MEPCSRRIASALVSGVLLWSSAALALDGAFGEFSYSLQNRYSVGAAVRLADRDSDLIGITNVPGQQNLCSVDDCLSFSGEAGPNQRLVNARGSFIGGVVDDGDLNFDRYDVVSAQMELSSGLRLGWRNFYLRLRGSAFLDPVNHEGEDRHTNTRFQPTRTPRPDQVEDQIGSDIELHEAELGGDFEIGDRRVAFALGRQIARWGESTFVALNSIAEINPPNANLLYRPGAQIKDIFQPVGALTLSADLSDHTSASFFYQLEWRPLKPVAAGSFFSDLEIVGGRDYLTVALGQFAEDPDGRQSFAGAPSLISSTSFRARMLDKHFARPPDDGQYGLRFNLFAPEFNGGTEISLYALNYHSRIPYVSVVASEESCARDSRDFVAAVLDCRGFKGSLNPTLLGLEPIPIDTLKVFLDYPRDIQLYGLSLNTVVFGWSIAGEYVYRPNSPAQVLAADVVYAGLQPALPRNDLIVGIPGYGELLTIPSARRFIPDFLSQYRGIDVQAGQIVRGYERLRTGQLDVTAIKILSSNPVGADQVLFIGELGATHVIGMPGRSELLFEGGVWHENSHPGPGANEGDSLRFNPVRQTGYFADPFAWGYRASVQFEYVNVLPKLSLLPRLEFYHDVDGIGVYPQQNFVEGRRQYTLALRATYKAFEAETMVRVFDGSAHILRDRDYMSLYFAYNF